MCLGVWMGMYVCVWMCVSIHTHVCFCSAYASVPVCARVPELMKHAKESSADVIYSWNRYKSVP